MFLRVTRLTYAEAIKIVSHRFFVFSILLLLAVIPLWSLLHGQEETVWRGPHAVQLFAHGAQAGLKAATLIILVFTTMLFAGEFDRGTIKLLLTRPVTRTDIFLSKCAIAALVTAFYVALVLYISLAFALAQGELGAVWDGEEYATFASYDKIVEHAETAVLLCLLPTLAAAFLGIFVSNLTEHSGYAVAYGLILYVVLDLASAFFHPGYLFPYYPAYAFDVLASFAEGSSALWQHEREESLTFLFAPLAALFAFAAAAYAVFRSRNVTV